jgi:nucleoside-diphosphate-sugar epimerase
MNAYSEPREAADASLSATSSILVVGGAGYIGSTLTRQLLEDGCRVRVLDALFYGSGAVDDLQSHPRFELVHGDTRDHAIVRDALRGIDAVVHVAELVGDPACAVDSRLTEAINFHATLQMAKLAHEAGVRRFIYPSSCSVYGASDVVVDEESALNPVSVYAETKIRSEAAILALAGHGFEPVILRLATVFGSSARPRFDLVVNLLAARAMVDHEVTLFGGSQWRPFVHVADAAAAVRLCLRAPASVVAGATFNVGSSDLNFTISEVAKAVLDATPGARLREVADPDTRNYRVSFDRIKQTLGYVPCTTIAQGIEEIQQAIASGAITDYRASRYSNVQALRAEQSAFAFPRAPGPSRRLAAS